MSERAAGYNVKYENTDAFKRAIELERLRLEKTCGTDYSGPDPSLIRALFEFSDWTLSRGAALLRVDVSTLRRWMADSAQRQSREIPYAAWCLLLLLSGNASAESFLGVES
ncbi:MAG: hypothetical protein ACSHXD_19555 [Marinosulfonomonas sp.]